MRLPTSFGSGGGPEGYAQDHWERATIEIFGDDACGHDNEYLQDEEKILAGRPDANMPAHLTKDVPGG